MHSRRRDQAVGERLTSTAGGQGVNQGGKNEPRVCSRLGLREGRRADNLTEGQLCARGLHVLFVMISQVRKCLREAKELALGHTAGERESTPKADLGADPGPPRRLPTVSSPVLVLAVSWPGAGLTGRAPYVK